MVTAEVALQLPPVREWVRRQAEGALASKWPGATIARCAAADVTGVARFDGVRLPVGGRAAVVLDGLEIALSPGAALRGRIEPARAEAMDTFVEADVPGIGKIALAADEGAKLPLSVVELPSSGRPARVRLSGPSRACLPSGRCLVAEALVEAEAARDDAGVLVRWQALADGVRIRPPGEPEIPLPSLAAHGEATRGGGEIAADASLSMGPHATIDVRGTSAAGRFALDVVSTSDSYAALLDSLPIVPAEARLAVDGPLQAKARIAGPLAQPEDWEIDATLDLTVLRARPENAAAGRRLVEPFLYRPSADPDAPAMWMGTRNPDFLPLSRTPEVVIRAVLLSEDSFFFSHPGFDADAIVFALKENLRDKRVRRGGSTITQQLAKNLWLSRDRTLLRKVQEALLTVSLEAAVPKERLLEIYLNGIEWGPGIYGVKRAARHYFDKEPAELTAKEAAYLATVIPNPRRYYVFFRKGAVSEKWEERVMHLVGKMRDAGTITPEQYEDAAWTPLRFASSGDDPWTEEIEAATVVPVDVDED